MQGLLRTCRCNSSDVGRGGADKVEGDGNGLFCVDGVEDGRGCIIEPCLQIENAKDFVGLEGIL
jgi:hypothetical protein